MNVSPMTPKARFPVEIFMEIIQIKSFSGSGLVENVEHVQVSPELRDWVQVRALGGSQEGNRQPSPAEGPRLVESCGDGSPFGREESHLFPISVLSQPSL